MGPHKSAKRASVAIKKSSTYIVGNGEVIQIVYAGRNLDQCSQQSLSFSVGERFLAHDLLVFEPCNSDPRPHGNFTFRLRISHEADLEFLKRQVQQRSNDLMHTPDLIQQFLRQTLVPNGTRAYLVQVDFPWLIHSEFLAV